MATTDLRAESVLTQLPPNFAPMPTVMRTLARFDRNKLEGFITVAIGLLDVLDGDPDAEAITNVEDEGIDPRLGEEMGPGCPVADHGEVAWVEWDKMPPSSKGGPNLTGCIPTRVNEDDEDDDPAEESDPVELNGDEGDYGGEVDGI